jgi:Zn-dependent membrane protease YugP
MKNIKWFNLIIGILVTLQSIFLTKVFAISVVLFILGILNLFIGFGAVERCTQKYQENKKKFDNKNPF